MIDSLNAVLLIKILQRYQASIVAGTSVVAIHAVKESDVVEMRAPSTCCYLVGSYNPPREGLLRLLYFLLYFNA